MSLAGSGASSRRGAAPLVEPDDCDAAEAMARRLLAATDRSGVELRRRLEQRGFSAATASLAVERLLARGWVDEGRLAENLARTRLDRGYGRRRVLADLVARGVDPEVVRRTAAELAGDQADAALVAAERLRPHHPGPPNAAELRRLAAALQRRGFDATDVRRALRALTDPDAVPVLGTDS